MTKTEAVAVNNVVAHLIGMKGVLSHLDTAATFDSALHSAALLADSAHKSLGTGLDGSDVRKKWNGQEG